MHPCRLGKLRITKGSRDTIEIDSTNVRQFTMSWRRGLPKIVDVEGQTVNNVGGETFVRFRNDGDDLWKVR